MNFKMLGGGSSKFSVIKKSLKDASHQVPQCGTITVLCLYICVAGEELDPVCHVGRRAKSEI